MDTLRIRGVLGGILFGVVVADLVFWSCKYCCGSLLPGRLVCSVPDFTGFLRVVQSAG